MGKEKEIINAWNTARKVAGAILAGDLAKEESPSLKCRFHDLRHTAISRMINAGVPITKVAKLVGFSPQQWWQWQVDTGIMDWKTFAVRWRTRERSLRSRVPGNFPGIANLKLGVVQ